MLDFQKACRVVLKEGEDLLSTLDEKVVQDFLKKVKEEWPQKRLFFWARGRSFLMLRGFAMRLMHMGYEVHIVGEVDCPAIAKGDVLLVASGSGGTSSVLLFAEKAHHFGAEVGAIVGKPGSPLGTQADWVLEFNPEQAGETVQLSSAGGGTRFEHSLLLFFDACILSLIFDQREKVYQEMMHRHANLE